MLVLSDLASLMELIGSDMFLSVMAETVQLHQITRRQQTGEESVQAAGGHYVVLGGVCPAGSGFKCPVDECPND